MIDVIQEYKNKGYRFFTEPYSMNIYAIRNKVHAPNKFNDILGVIYNNGLVTINFQIPATVDPGTHWLVNPMDRGGAAAIAAGQYPRLWQLGKFRGSSSLIQISPVSVYRDGNKDAVFDYIPQSITRGMYGIFAHPHFQATSIAQEVSTSSAGCVVPQRNEDWAYFYSLIELQHLMGLGNTYTFTLFE